ncbi:MAG TPA: S-methyl-5-thioribose-1-phosphate isomerase [Candidatus Limnocylindrales bacterium]|nr:S-methyl-5-thioribose-1-phosphate isomerase [Candidatus Limnocylindrales bacterium]
MRKPRGVEPISWKAGRLRLLDQRKLPHKETWIGLRGAADTARAIRDMVVRGAPAIGVTAAFGLALEARRFRAGRVLEDFEKAARILKEARPTAVNLAWAIERQRQALVAASSGGEEPSPAAAARTLRTTAEDMFAADVAANRAMGAAGAPLLKGDVLTHCNAGALATAGYGTALGVIRASWEKGRRFGVYATETRPFLQGARLTSWELVKLGIPVTLVTDGMVGALLASGRIGAIVVGTDRTAANGDVANKIGTYTIAVLAKRHGIPFYVAAPTSSIDLGCATGADIPIEERSEREVTHIGGKRIAARGVSVFHPAFDVTPAELVTAIFTESGVVEGDYKRGLARAVAEARGMASAAGKALPKKARALRTAKRPVASKAAANKAAANKAVAKKTEKTASGKSARR